MSESRWLTGRLVAVGMVMACLLIAACSPSGQGADGTAATPAPLEFASPQAAQDREPPASLPQPAAVLGPAESTPAAERSEEDIAVGAVLPPRSLAASIAISANGRAVEPGANTPSSANHTDFGVVTHGSRTIRVFTIRNDGAEPVRLADVQVPEGFTVVVPPAEWLEPGVQTTFEVAMNAPWGGTYLGQIGIGVGNPGVAPITFAVRGTVIAPVFGTTVLANGLLVAHANTAVSNDNNTLFALDDVQESLSAPRTLFSTNVQAVAPQQPTGPTAPGIGPAVPRLNSPGTTAPLPNPAAQVCTPNYMLRYEIERQVIVPVDQVIRRQFVLYNHEANALTIAGISVLGDFELVGPVAQTLTPKSSMAFEIQMDTSLPGIKVGTVRIEQNIGIYEFHVVGAVSDARPNSSLIVIGNGNRIALGETTPQLANHTDFGSVVQRSVGSAATRTYTICNAAETTVTLGAIEVPDHFTIVQRPATAIPPRGATNLVVQVLTDVEGAYRGEVRIDIGGGNSPAYTFAIAAVVLGPQPPRVVLLGNERSVINRSTVASIDDHTDFGSVATGGLSATRVFTVRNGGDQPLLLGAIQVPEGFVLVAPPAVSVAPGVGTTFAIRMDTRVPGEKLGVVRFTHNGVNLDPYEFTIRGVVTE